MKIVVDARNIFTTTGRYTEKLLEYLQAVDKKNHYVVLLKSQDLNRWEPKSKRFVKVACIYKEFGFGEQIGLCLQLYKLKPDLVYFPMTQQPVLYMRDVVTTIHDLTSLRFGNPSKNRFVFKIKQRVFTWVTIIVAHKSKHIITPTTFVKNDVAKFARINSRKITVTHESADLIKQPSQSIEDLEKQAFILYVGRPQPHKNLEKLVLAFSNLKQTYPELRLVLVGKTDGLYKRLEKFAKKQRVDNIIFTGFVSEGELRWLYENAEAYVFPSLSEGFGLPGLEAMVHGCPVVSSNATCLPEVYGDAAVYFDPEDVDDMATNIKRVLRNEKLRKELVQKGYKQARKYSWQKMAEQTLEVYNSVLGK